MIGLLTNLNDNITTFNQTIKGKVLVSNDHHLTYPIYKGFDLAEEQLHNTHIQYNILIIFILLHTLSKNNQKRKKEIQV
jgi:hypothetical protein